MPERSASTMSVATRKSSSPPAIWNAASEMPRRSSNARPAKAKTRSSAAAIPAPRQAVLRRCAGATCAARPTNITAVPTGSTMTRSVTKS
jgi:hypothetical protein